MSLAPDWPTPRLSGEFVNAILMNRAKELKAEFSTNLGWRPAITKVKVKRRSSFSTAISFQIILPKTDYDIDLLVDGVRFLLNGDEVLLFHGTTQTVLPPVDRPFIVKWDIHLHDD